MRFLLIDEDAAYRELLRYHLTAAWPDAQIDERAFPDSGQAGPVASHGYDAILLGFPRDAEKGLERLGEARRTSDAPVIVFAAAGDELLAVDSLHAGAASYFPKSRVRHARLIRTIRSAVGAAGGAGSAAAPLRSFASGKTSYRIVRLLHSSALANVYLAAAGAPEREVVLKVFRYVPDTGGEQLFDRFLQEYQIIAAIEHPNVVRIHDLGVADDHAFIAMEYLSAGSLAERLNASLAPDVALDCLRQIASALGSVHAAGILHRDLKPANIMFRADGTLAVIDFGLAKHSESTLALTDDGQIFGTPYYMSPEQGHAEPADARSDLYSLGCMLYEMLTGQRPFVATTAMGVIYQHAHAPRPCLPTSLARFQPVLDRLLAPVPDARFPSAQALSAALDGLG